MARTVDPAKHEAKRQHILGAAYRCFARKGFAATTTADICRTAGISAGNLFHYFPSKQAVFFAIFEHDAQEVSSRLAQAATSTDPWGGLLRYLEHALGEAADPDAIGFMLAVITHAQHDPEVAALLEHNDREQLAGLTTLLRRAAELGQIDGVGDGGASDSGTGDRIDPETAANWLAVLLDGVFLRLGGSPNFQPLEQLPTLTLLVSRFLGATEVSISEKNSLQ